MAVRVRLFAALREAAGTGEDTAAAGPLAHVLESLCERYGPTFRMRLAVSAVLVDGQPVSDVDDVDVADGSEVALLPPVSGGGGE